MKNTHNKQQNALAQLLSEHPDRPDRPDIESLRPLCGHPLLGAEQTWKSYGKWDATLSFWGDGTERVHIYCSGQNIEPTGLRELAADLISMAEYLELHHD